MLITRNPISKSLIAPSMTKINSLLNNISIQPLRLKIKRPHINNLVIIKIALFLQYKNFISFCGNQK